MRSVFDALRLRRDKRLENQAADWFVRTRIESTERLFDQAISVLREVLGSTREPPFDLRDPDRPDSSYLGDIGLDAYVRSYATESDALPDVMTLLKTGRIEVAPGHIVFQRADSSSSHTYYAVEPWFGGQRVHVLSNDGDIFIQLKAAKIRPPPPWVAFPNFEPPSVLLQGTQQFWFENVWDPFFQSLTLPERVTYLTEHKAPAEWVEDLSCRLSHPSDSGP